MDTSLQMFHCVSPDIDNDGRTDRLSVADDETLVVNYADGKVVRTKNKN